MWMGEGKQVINKCKGTIYDCSTLVYMCGVDLETFIRKIITLPLRRQRQ